ncbi:hypothetical protein N7495_001303 [Penicillium taxi]|uniref:uncharacterized protein n=1 Tax=Penicillium taxi TaxID=168475 RepID=UPI0025455E55|nr:uncharacterized protein N7495_001303 [Penicillium taxi]KAJ5908621.1 hypothetical protein N7495_001303 [Penicillium taxi]
MNQSKKMAMEHSDLSQGLSLSADFLPLSDLVEILATRGHAAVLQQQSAGISFIHFVQNQRQRQLLRSGDK